MIEDIIHGSYPILMEILLYNLHSFYSKKKSPLTPHNIIFCPQIDPLNPVVLATAAHFLSSTGGDATDALDLYARTYILFCIHSVFPYDAILLRSNFLLLFFCTFDSI